MNPQFFTFAEMTATAQKADNTPTWAVLANIRRLADFLDDVRREFGKPIRVNSAFRSAAVNAAVGGSGTSAHLSGLAADICAWSGKEADNRALLKILKTYTVDQLISYHVKAGDANSAIRFFHVGLSVGDARCQYLVK